MSYTAFVDIDRNKEELKEELDSIEFQLFRMQENVKEIAKKFEIISIDRTKEENWAVIYVDKKSTTFQIMLHECTKPFRGNWDSAIEVEYKNERTIHICDIKGEENKGFGSVLINQLKEIAREENKQFITGDIVQRDFDHVHRLKHFYCKHYFNVNIDHNQQSGEIIWTDS
ncbi:hypothetical protein [Virgibacillus salexigens]|uniref:hypothetical protein n=1 Tax=Virgibacillus salexigens TaxID=61016 RepID=UPI00190C5CE3|nr:hypothetical protein [Virgibacillus salexigens]